jgi:cell filamentation protein
VASGFDHDPHSQDGTTCPRNFFGITSHAELAEQESYYVSKRAYEIAVAGVTGRFDVGHLRKIHWSLFRDIFPWAGEFRVVGLAKVGGAPFAPPIHIASALGEALDKLKNEGFIKGLEKGRFAQRAAFYLGEINAIHPFREGNGRTQREFIRQLAKEAGHTLLGRHDAGPKCSGLDPVAYARR